MIEYKGLTPALLTGKEGAVKPYMDSSGVNIAELESGREKQKVLNMTRSGEKEGQRDQLGRSGEKGSKPGGKQKKTWQEKVARKQELKRLADKVKWIKGHDI